MAGNAQILNVFIASPSDVPDERDAVERVVAEVNQRMSPLGWMVRSTRWEYVSRGLGSPQKRINKFVDDCDVLVAVVHRRWGTATQEYTSGFEEEFERVRARRDAGEEVDALLFLRELDEGEEADESLVAFRERAKSLALLHQYRDVDEFASRLFQELVTELVRRTQTADAGEQAALPAGPEPRELPAGDKTVATSGGPGAEQQASAALEALGAVFREGSADFDLQLVTRAHLAATAALAANALEAVLGVHEINQIYAYRDALRLTAAEKDLIGRTMCEHGFRAPGWQMLSSGARLRNITIFALSGRPATVRVGALRELGTRGLRAGAAELVAPIDGLDAVDVYLLLARSDDELLRAALAKLIPGSGLAEREILLALIAAEGGVGAHRLLVSELIDSDPTAACELVAEAPTWLKPDAETRLLDRAQEIADYGLEALEDSGARGMRIAWRLRARSGRLDLRQAVDLLDDEKASVRQRALEALVDAGVLIPLRLIAAAVKTDRDTFAFDSNKRHALFLRAAQLHPVDTLMEGVSWLDARSGLSLRAAARREDGEPAVERARQILREGTGHERSTAIARFAADHDDPDSARHAAELLAEEHEDFFDSQLIEHALNALATRPSGVADADVARSYVQGHGPFSSRVALQILASYGEPQDIPTLLTGLNKTPEDADREVLIAGALRLTPSVDALIERIRSATERPDQHIPGVLKTAAAGGLSASEGVLVELLHDASDEVRIAAAKSLAVLQTRAALQQTLAAYVDGDGYRYYNVIGILDRALYAPDEIADQTRLT